MKFNRKFFAAMSIALLMTSPLTIHAIAETTETKIDASEFVDANNHSVKKGVIKVGVDKKNMPINIAYTMTGNVHKHDKVILFADPYFGQESWDCQVEAMTKAGHLCIVIDPIGYGKSSQTAPTDLDGVYGTGENGYSLAQQAIFHNKLLKGLGINCPIVYVAVDTQGNAAMRYAVDFAADQLKVEKLVLINTSPQGVTGDDPCRLTFLSTAQAQALTQFFAADPCAALCALLKTSFNEPACPEYGAMLYNASVNFNATQPAAVFERLVMKTYAEDTSSLMQLITIPVLYLYGVIDTTDILSRKAEGMAFTGYCPGCAAGCTNATYIPPFPNCQIRSFAGKGTVVNRSDAKRVNESLKDFISGDDAKCTPCKSKVNVPVICAVCA